MIKVSVIVPFYNSERYIKGCIEGLLQQSYPREQYEILMIDNNSTDISAETVRQYPGIQLLHETMQGSYAARNRGLREAKGEVMAFIDADCVPSHDWLHEIMLAMEKPDLSIVLGRRTFAGNSILLSMFADYEDEKHKYVFTSDKQEIYYGHTNNMAVKKKLFNELGLFVERLRGSDTIFVRHAVNTYSCEVVRYCPRIQVRHLEIENLQQLFQKFSIYGRTNIGTRHVVCQKTLTAKEKFHVFRNVVRHQEYSWKESIVLMGVLGMGVVYWVLGKIKLSGRERDSVE
ncbi:glycosyltransferase [Nitrospira sp. T9]|uniref:glycosyltransferase n=1 Tax=unclassified Nitrospira TaxID=2652172 RepID=UPI003F96C613